MVAPPECKCRLPNAGPAWLWLIHTNRDRPVTKGRGIASGKRVVRWADSGKLIHKEAMRRIFIRLAGGLLSLLFAANAARGQATALTYTSITIPMRDTNSLAADLWYASPTLTAKPVILIQTPYNRKLYRTSNIPGYAGGASFPADTNYNYVIVDWRGFYGSLGAAAPGYNRGLDGYDCTEWIAAQPWSNGRIGTWGSSALGQIQYQTAFQQPPHLVCCNVQVRHFQTRYDDYYYGGDYRKEETESIASLGFFDPSQILAHPDDDLYWKTVEAVTDTPDKLTVPVLVVGGWFDHSPDSVLRSFAEIQTNSAAPVQSQHRFIFGPWTHGGVGELTQGGLDFPNATNLFDTEIQFWDYQLRDQTNDGWSRQPVVQFYQLGENIWVDNHNWNGAATWAGMPRATQTLYFRVAGQLTPTPPGTDEGADGFAYDPNDPTPSFGGARFTPFTPTTPEGPQDESTNIETRTDVLVYSTPVLTNDLRLNATNLTVTLYAASDRTDTDFAVRLTDVYPDGRSLILAQGIRRARFRNSLRTEQLMTPGAVYAIPVQIQNLACTFRQGHRLRLVISSADYPMYDRNLNDGGPMYVTNGTPLVAHNTVWHDAAHRSRLDFQTLPEDLDGDGLPDVWEADNFGTLARDGSGDLDGDGISDLNEYLAGTQPTNAASLFRIENLVWQAPTNLAITWSSVSNRHYSVLAATGSLTAAYSPVATNLPATPPLNGINLTPPAAGPVFFRVSVQP